MTENDPPDSGEYGCFIHGPYDHGTGGGEMTCRKCEATIRALMLPDLYSVGPGKPIGYLLLRAIYRTGFKPSEVQQELEEGGRVVRVYKPNEWHSPKHGALYVYAPSALATFIAVNAASIREAGWPLVPRDFAHAVATIHVVSEQQPDLYPIIVRAFGGFDA